MNDEALSAYTERVKDAQEAVNRINEYLAQCRSLRINPGRVNWPAVGDLSHVCELLREVVNFIEEEERMNNTVTREERGWGGHYILARRCQFRRNTLLTCGERRVVVPTVGAELERDERTYTHIGHKRYYETWAFEAAYTDGYWDLTVNRRISVDAPSQIDHIDLHADAEANAMHEAVVTELTAKLAAGTLPVTEDENA